MPKGGVPRVELLERAGELRALHEAVADARSGKGALILLHGAAGLGKTSLLAEARRRAAVAGLERLHGGGAELETAFSFGLAVQLLERPVAAARPPDRSRLLGDGGEALGRLLAGEGARGEEAALVEGLAALVARLARRRPLLLAVDDVQWADDPSVRLLCRLADEIAELPCLAVVALRTGRLDDDRSPLAALASHPAARRLEVRRPLSPAGSLHLVTSGFAPAPVGAAFAAACHDVTAGNPLFLRALVRAMRTEGVAPRDESVEAVREMGPEPVRRAAQLVLGRVGGDAVVLARAVAILGGPVPLARATALAGLDEERAKAVAGALADAGLMRPGPGLAFIHPIVRTGIYGDLGAAARDAAHHRAAGLLRREGRPVEEVASHLMASAPRGDREAVAALRAAAERAVPGGAVAYLRRALAEGVGEERPVLLAELARAEAAEGSDAAAGRFAEAVAAAPRPVERAALEADRSRHLLGRMRFAEALAAAERGLAEVGTRDAAVAADLETARVSAALWARGSTDDVYRRLAALARGDAEGAPPQRVLLALLAVAEMVRGRDPIAAERAARAAWSSGAILGEAPPDGAPLLGIASTLAHLDRFDEAEDVWDAIIADAHRRGLRVRLASALAGRAMTRLGEGRVREARADAEASIEAHGGEWAPTLPWAVAARVLALLEQGRPEAAARALADVPHAAEPPGPEQPHGAEAQSRPDPSLLAVLEARARLALAARDWGAALEEALRLGAMLDALAMGGAAFRPWRPVAATAAARLGDAERALSIAGENLELARQWGSPRPLGVALRTRGTIEPRGEGLSWIEESVRVLEGSGAQLELAWALAAQGERLRAAGRRAEARAPLLRALGLADRLGAVRLGDRARMELRAAGASVPASATSAPRSKLTAAELRVADMAAAGATNREIADALLVTVKAVEYHLANAYRKLGIRGRGALGRALSQGPEGE